jgi:hypothetical protein
MHGNDDNLIQTFMGKPEGNKPLGRPKCWWDNIKMM